jgi:hypothetical protein
MYRTSDLLGPPKSFDAPRWFSCEFLSPRGGSATKFFTAGDAKDAEGERAQGVG